MINFRDISDAEYFSAKEYINSSSLKTILNKSPAHVLAGFEDTEATIFGTAFHKYVLQNDLFWSENVILPRFDKETGEKLNYSHKKNKDAKEKIVSENPSKNLLDEEDFMNMEDMAKNLEKNSLYPLFKQSRKEVSVFSEDFKGCKAKIKLDGVHEDSEGNITVFDLKTIAETPTHSIVTRKAMYDYAIQASFYTDLLLHEGAKSVQFIWIFAEKKLPFQCGYYIAGNSVLEAGRSAYNLAIDIYKDTILKGSYLSFPATYEPVIIEI